VCSHYVLAVLAMSLYFWDDILLSLLFPLISLSVPQGSLRAYEPYTKLTNTTS